MGFLVQKTRGLTKYQAYTTDQAPSVEKKFENATLFLRLDLPSTLIRHENGVFRKRYSNWRNLKTLALLLSVDGE